jgi:hypothetical protein
MIENDMNLSHEQMQALDSGQAVPVTIDGKRCVVVREEVYDRVKRVIDYGEMDPEEAYPAILEAWDSVGCPDDANYT